ncbi:MULTISPECIES: hypothetical protein [Brachybacterium]|uniref:Heavy metal transporter n=2 Tax=Brachybacterium TaxID=43668 RepID=A0A3R8SFV6_9MICO|nr:MULTISPECIES: hypothetical protein [Brachybacterium]MCT1437064.1 hypothetical protein [Brachybacterium paraconglomeratum]RRR20072.1 hypothetical protein DS079_01310 [Brachybacterium paraconglomeratum]GLI31928.1 hypothetical protein BCONGLO52_27690 [Brachybacterium conglomeratum]GLK03461.1 hypothetical protein GCM10017597_02600 [Brachybacterium conglomeratum]
MAAGSRARGRARGRVGRHLAVPLVMVLVFGGIAGGSYLALERYGSPAHEGTCVASGLGTSHRYTTDRVANAALISATAVDRGMPPRAASIALATAYQESQLQNIDYGDRDSLGLFQQRPSQGWGTEEQIMDPVYASNAFFDVLETYPDYISADINDIAQQVQRSGHPEAYRDHETEGRLYASALTGQSGANLLCTLDEVGATASPEQLRGELARQFPRATESGRITASLDSAAGAAPQVPEGAGATALVLDPGGDETLGWSLANWAVARAADDGVVQVSYRGRVWDRTAHGEEAGAWGSAEGGDPERVVVLVSGR